MAKKIIFAVLIMLPFFCKGQLAVGDWKIHSIFGNKPNKVIDTKDIVYFMSDSTLYSYNKAQNEHESFTKRNKLSDITIRNIVYNFDKKYLLIVYKNSNIDFLYDNGKIINLPDIKDAILTSSKNINDINFKGDRVYVATDFGYVVLNDIKHEVAESQNYNKKIKSIAPIGEYLFISDDSKLYVGKLKDIHPTLSTFQATNIAKGIDRLIPLNDNSFIYFEGWTYKAVIGADPTQLDLYTVFNTSIVGDQITSKGVLLQAKNQYKILDKEAKEIEVGNIPSALQSSFIGSYGGDKNFWILDKNGLKNSKIDNGTETVLSDYFKPNASTVLNPYNTFYNTAQNKLYVINTGSNRFVGSYTDLAAYNTLDGAFWNDITPTTFVTSNGSGTKNKAQGAYQPVLHPDDPNTFFVGSWFEGAYKISEGKQVAKYDWTNSPMNLDWYCCAVGLQFDKNKNLWIVEADGKNQLMVLPYSKLSQATLTAADWYVPVVPGMKLDKKAKFIITKKDDLKIFTSGVYGSLFYVLDDNGTPNIASDDVSKSYTSFIDQDEKSYEWLYMNCFAEDKNGKLWIGTDNGVVETIPANSIKNNFRVNRIKVPRNDGTQYADYLLENTDVTCIAVDGSNRKWIGTFNAGVFLVSEDGSKIINNFTMSNSYLTSNQIVSVTCNPNNNSVYIGTPYGITEYSSDSSPAEENYDNVYAYPNPVRPDYTGWITIRGLMDNSLIKIADAAGNVFSSGRSSGGMYIWDGCNSSGEKVKTGVYFVFASQNENGSSSGAVTKILIVN